jgi:hypothetical protein
MRNRDVLSESCSAIGLSPAALLVITLFLCVLTPTAQAQSAAEPTSPASIRLPDDDFPTLPPPTPTLAVTTAAATAVKEVAVTPTPKPSPANDPLSLQLEFAESALRVSNNLPNLARVIALYERAVAFMCPGKKVRCEQVVSRLLELDPGNPPALCAKFSVVSPECREVMAAQELGWFDVDAGRWRTIVGNDGGELEPGDLPSAIEIKRNKPKADKLAEERDMLVRMPVRETVQEQQLDKVLLEGIGLTCGAPKIVLLSRDGATPQGLSLSGGELTPTTSGANSILPPDPYPLDAADGPTSSFSGGISGPSTDAPPRGANPFDSVLTGLKALPTPIPTAQPTKGVTTRISVPLEQRLRRIRLLSRDCYEFVRVATGLRPGMIQGRCALDGWYAPSCKAAMVHTTGGGGPATADGMERF